MIFSHAFRKFNMCGVVAVISIGIPAMGYAQTIRSEVLQVSDPRPLAAAADLLERKYAVAINYEDPLYVFAGDLVDQTNPSYRLAHPDKRAIVPKGGALTWRVDVDTRAQTLADPMAMLQSLVGIHAASGNPGEFTVKRIGSAYVIVPARAKNESGTVVARSSPLDVSISFPEQRISGIDAVKLICQTVSQPGAIKVTMGVVPYNLLQKKTVLLGANNETARNVLARALDGLKWANPHIVAPDAKLGWRLFYGADIQAYALNIHPVIADVPNPFGGTVRRPVLQ